VQIRYARQKQQVEDFHLLEHLHSSMVHFHLPILMHPNLCMDQRAYLPLQVFIF
jgi:hypothetical protein